MIMDLTYLQPVPVDTLIAAIRTGKDSIRLWVDTLNVSYPCIYTVYAGNYARVEFDAISHRYVFDSSDPNNNGWSINDVPHDENAEALKRVYYAVGGDNPSVEKLTESLDVLNQISGVYGGPTDAKATFDAICNIAGNYSGGANEPYAEYTYDEDGYVTTATLYGFTVIPRYMFSNMARLTCVDLTNSPNLESIGASAFDSCRALDSIIGLPDTISSIGSYAFSQCQALALTRLPSNLTSIGNSAFYLCFNLALTELPSGLVDIGNQAFVRCESINIHELPSSISTLGAQAFQGCTGLDTMIIGAQALPSSAFESCTGLTDVWIRSSCTDISAAYSYSRAPFKGCSNIQSIYAEPNSKPGNWGNYFNYIGSSTAITVQYGQTTSPF